MVLVVAEPVGYASGAVGQYPVSPRWFLLVAGVAPALGDRVGRSRPCAAHGRSLSISSNKFSPTSAKTKLDPAWDRAGPTVVSENGRRVDLV